LISRVQAKTKFYKAVKNATPSKIVKRQKKIELEKVLEVFNYSHSE
jgi:hypothetical protein